VLAVLVVLAIIFCHYLIHARVMHFGLNYKWVSIACWCDV